MYKLLITLKINKIYYVLFIIYTYLSSNTNIIAKIYNKHENIIIHSNEQSMNLIHNTLTFTGNVIIYHKSIEINADTITIKKNHNTKEYDILEGCGNPILFYKTKNKMHYIYGESRKIYYEINNKIIIFSEKVYLKQLDNCIKSDNIMYIINKKYIKAYSNNNNQVVTTINIKI